ncbi:MAG: elongation factor P--(R)-beta-lysine ligase [Psychromonas sp.]|nr:elongation factor P--(R)-beta-lysine ligase [Psychromonas sp.]
MNWFPCANLNVLKQRALIISQIRRFFTARNLLEVETPSLSQSGVTDEHLFSFKTHFLGTESSSAIKAKQGTPLYLQTSPEFHMKRLLSSGSGSIFQIAKVFRNEGSGRYHSPEFTLLEWYQIDFDHHKLMDEMDELLQLILNTDQATRCTYQQAFLTILKVDPLTASIADLKKSAEMLNLSAVLINEMDKDTVLQLLFCCAVEPVLANERPCFVYDFPRSQAALARISPHDGRVAERFEVYYKGIELANGFHELNDAKEQLLRFKNDNKKRKQKNIDQMPIDRLFIESLSHLPNCAGVALGIDRLVMLAIDAKHIDNVLSFPINTHNIPM